MQIVPRLINSFIPSSYKLSISLNRIGRVFDGIVTIEGTLQPNFKKIIVHSKELAINSIVFDGKTADYSSGKNDALIITHPDMSAGEHIIVIDFSGTISDSMHGMYPCYYEHDGIKKELLATQFESHHSREVFPCIDEPEAKATFDVTLITERGVTVLGNMPIHSQKIDEQKLVTTFETTPVMSTYLLAWVVGELHKRTANTHSGVEVNVWATPAQPDDSLDFALDIATKSIDYFDDYFGTPYPLPKCDHVALPDFGSGAMENWGLITYREIALLAEPEKTSIANKRYVATVIAHELSHQWFGNLVTMKWWNDLWLNESFASLVEYDAIDSLEPEWNVWLDFASYESIAALRRDSLAGVQPVQTEVNHPDEISTLFDGAIVYAKGARLLKMLRHLIGEQAFQAGIKQYFHDFAYKNTETSDLWASLGESSNRDISSFMNVWIQQPGFPVLHVSKKGNQVTLSQERLVSRLANHSNALWPIPLNSNCQDMPEILDVPSATVTMNDETVLRFNIGSNAHFVTHYDSQLLGRIIDQIKSGGLSTLDRLQILNEQTILAKAGIISSADLVPLLDAYKHESTESVWGIISLSIGDLKRFVEFDDEAEQKLRSFAGELASEQYARLGWEPKPNESETDTKLRSTIVALMIYSENPDIIKTASNLYHSTQLENLDPELRGLVISTVIRHEGSVSIIKTLLETYKTTASVEVKQDINSGLTATRDAASIELLLDTLTDKSVIRTQDTFRWVAYLIGNKYAREQTWLWVRENWDWIEKTFAGDKSYDDYPMYVAQALSTPVQLEEYKSFFEPMLNVPALSRVIEMGINEITDRVDSINRDGEAVRKALLDL